MFQYLREKNPVKSRLRVYPMFRKIFITIVNKVVTPIFVQFLIGN